MHNGLSIYQTK